ncbi:periplasmic binding protein [Fibrisoma limi BUZ 3]|uniref:Periplasmic binding protein n=1 Tax=Fibrisoma limi BUZ 3 TaxID=1185876 RepID=I2GKE5_9BACT|nr:helical backbone metal receptor [Fibrisoma limi]CCH54370.1 periplasmic binding protein [Fibrisoma limi BUZ 3]
MLPQRIISVVPSQTELLFDLGLDEDIVGITKFCIHPVDKVKDKPIVGGTKTLHIERIHELQPDLIIANKEENTREQIEELQRHYSVHITDMSTLADALTMIREVGRLVGRELEADRMAQQIAASFGKIAPQPPERGEKPEMPGSAPPSGGWGVSVAYFIWRKPYMVAGCDTFINAMLEAAGFQNAFDNLSRYPAISETDLQAARPDCIFLSSEPYPFKDKHIAELQAICPSAQVMLVDGELFSWYGSRLLQTADYLESLRQNIRLASH